MSSLSLQSAGELEANKIVFPPLMAALDTYLNSAGDSRKNEAIDKVKMKIRRKKTKSKSSTKSTTLSPSDLAPITNAVLPRPDSTKAMEEFSSPRKLKFTEANVTANPNRYRSESPVEEDHGDFRFIKEPSMVSAGGPRQSAGSPTTQFSAVRPSPRSAPKSGRSKVNESRAPAAALAEPSKFGTDLGFGKAVESIAALKLHNFAMKRREHASHKIKVI